MKKVCILTSVHAPNDNRVYYKEVLSLARMGYHVVFVAPNQQERKEGNIEYVSLSKPSSRIKRFFGFYSVYRKAKQQQCDVYHFQDVELIPTAFLLKWFTRAKLIYDVHEDYPSQMLTKYYLKSFMRKPLYHLIRFLERQADKHFDAIVVADNFVRKNFQNKNTIIAYNFPDIRLMSDAMQSDVKKEFDIIFPGSMAKFTAEMILQIAHLAKQQGVALKCALISPFRFVGGMEWVKQRIDELGLRQEDFLLKYRIPPYEVPHYIQRTRVGLIPLPDTAKMRVNIPTKMFEYMYCGVPVITGNLPPCGQFLEKDAFGYLVDPNSADEYTKRVLELVQDESKAEQMGQLGKTLVEQQYNWESEEKKLKDLYQTLLS